MTPYAEAYARAQRLIEGEPDELFEVLDRVLGAADPEVGDRLSETVRLGDMALAARLDPWRVGPPQPNVHAAVRKVLVNLHDPVVLGLGVRLAVGYARMGRVDADTHRLTRLASRLDPEELGHPAADYAREAAAYYERAPFLPDAAYTYGLVGESSPGEVVELANAQLHRQNASFAVLLAEMRMVCALDPWYVGQHLRNVERALERYRERRPAELQDLAVVLARAYVRGAFVDLRARAHVLGVLEGEEAQLLGPEAAIGLREYCDRDGFDYPPTTCYGMARDLDPDAFRSRVREHVRQGGLQTAQRLCEMALIRGFDDWYVGDYRSNLRVAVERYVQSGERDADVDWAARTLAGIYAATLDASAPARALVEAVLARDPEAPELLEALDGAGIPGDVAATELLEVFREATDPGAQLEAFREEARSSQDFGPYEQNALGEAVAFGDEGGTTLEEVSRVVGELTEAVVPAGLLRSATQLVENALRLAVSGTEATSRAGRVLGELARRDPALRSLDRLRTADLRVLDEVAWELTVDNRLAAALEGFGCGLGGTSLVLIDLPMLILVNLNAIHTVATAYGFDFEDEDEQAFAIEVLASGPEATREVLRRHGLGLGRGPHDPTQEALAFHRAAARIAARLARQKLLQVVPLVGGAVGAGVNFHFTYATSRAAVMAYRLRWLLRRFGSA